VTLHPAILDLETGIDSINILIYADSGVGKTVFTATAPKCLILSTEPGGTVSAKIHGSKAKVWHIRAWSDLIEAYEWLRDNPDHGFDWVILDTATEMQVKLVYHILGIAVADNEDRNPDIPSLQDHQEWQNKFLRFIDLFCDLPVNVVFTAHAMTVSDDDGEDVLLPQLKGGESWKAIARSMCAKMTIVGYMRVITVKDAKDSKKETEIRRIRWRKSGSVTAKDRTDSLGVVMDQPNMVEVARRIGAAISVGLPKELPSSAAPSTTTGARRRRAATTPPATTTATPAAGRRRRAAK
jgi:hypothetical protein